jgi:hypothetical protein
VYLASVPCKIAEWRRSTTCSGWPCLRRSVKVFGMLALAATRQSPSGVYATRATDKPGMGPPKCAEAEFCEVRWRTPPRWQGLSQVAASASSGQSALFASQSAQPATNSRSARHLAQRRSFTLIPPLQRRVSGRVFGMSRTEPRHTTANRKRTSSTRSWTNSRGTWVALGCCGTAPAIQAGHLMGFTSSMRAAKSGRREVLVSSG